MGWEKYTSNGISFGINSFGKSAPYKQIYKHFGLTSENIISEIEANLYEQFDREVPSREIGEKVMESLRHLDHVAFVRFASVYREFQDVNDFVEELQPIIRGDTPR